MSEITFGLVFFATVIILVLGLVFGWARGLVRMLLVTAVTVFAILATQFTFPYASQFLKEKTNVYDKIEEKIEEKIEDEAGSLLPGSNAGKEMDKLSSKEQEKFIEGLSYPTALKGLLLKNNDKSVYKSLGADSFSEYVSSYLATLIVRVIGYLVLFFVFFLIAFIILMQVEKAMHLPGLNIINRMLGCVLGLVIALVFVWAAYLVITAASSTEGGANMLEQIHSNPVTQFIYENNLLLWAVGQLGF